MASSNLAAANQKNVRIPPIVIRDQKQWKTILPELQSASNEFKATATSTEIKVRATSIDAYRKITKVLEMKKIDFHTYALHEDVQNIPIKVVIRGIPSAVADEKEVEAELKRLKFTPLNVVQMTSYIHKIKLPIFQVQLPKNQADEIYALRYFLGLVVRVEAYETPVNLISQCHRCQAWGHNSKHCYAQNRCVKCAGPHATEECNFSGRFKIQCINCKGNHTANYKGCPVYKAIKEKQWNHPTKIEGMSDQRIPATPTQQRQLQKPVRRFQRPSVTIPTTPHSNTATNTGQSTTSNPWFTRKGKKMVRQTMPPQSQPKAQPRPQQEQQQPQTPTPSQQATNTPRTPRIPLKKRKADASPGESPALEGAQKLLELIATVDLDAIISKITTIIEVFSKLTQAISTPTPTAMLSQANSQPSSIHTQEGKQPPQ